jgi:stress-induced morphogen
MAKKATSQPECPAWENKRTAETRKIEQRLRDAGFAQLDAYRCHSASIRIRIVDPQFEGKRSPEREDMVFPVIDKLPKRTREDILLLLTLAPSEVGQVNRHALINLEFEDPLTIGR